MFYYIEKFCKFFWSLQDIQIGHVKRQRIESKTLRTSYEMREFIFKTTQFAIYLWSSFRCLAEIAIVFTPLRDIDREFSLEIESHMFIIYISIDRCHIDTFGRRYILWSHSYDTSECFWVVSIVDICSSFCVKNAHKFFVTQAADDLTSEEYFYISRYSLNDIQNFWNIWGSDEIESYDS